MANRFQSPTPLAALTPPPFAERAFQDAMRPTTVQRSAAAQAAPAAQERPRLIEDLRRALRTAHYSRRTERAYVYWVQRFLGHHGKREPVGMGADAVRSFLSHLAVHDRVTASTQNQALYALVFLYGRVLRKDVGLLEGLDRAKAPKRLPVVLTRTEVKAVLEQMSGPSRLVCMLLYGAGLRLVECLTLRVKDIDFERNEITVRDGKGAKDRVTVLPESCRDGLTRHLERIHRHHLAGRCLVSRLLGRVSAHALAARRASQGSFVGITSTTGDAGTWGERACHGRSVERTRPGTRAVHGRHRPDHNE